MKNNTVFKEGYCIRDQHATHFLTFTVCGWIDLFTRKTYRDILLESFQYCRNHKGLILNAYVIMSNHLHLIARAKEENYLSDIIRDIKAYTHRQMIRIIESEEESRRHWMLHQLKYYASRHARNEHYQIWIQHSHPEELLTHEMTLMKLNYIHENPVRAGYVANPQDYLYSSASNYINGKGLIEVDFLF
jgi:REP element-mobilizing transposase RayT